MQNCKAIIPEDLERQISIIPDVVALFVRTSWWKKRDLDIFSYCNDHPWISEELPDFLREKCPALRIFGIDQISVATPAHRDIGRECHRRFLCRKSPILLIEDMDLSDTRLLEGAYTLHVYPFLVDDLDGVPVIAIMEG
jgi:arylformamidase